MRNLRKYGYEEYFVNKTHLRKLYGMYLDKNIYNKILDKLVFFAIVTIVMSVVMPFFFDISPRVLFYINSATTFVLLIFILELFRNYAHSRSGIEFLKKNWIDFILVVFLSFYFLFISFLSLINLKIFEALKLYISDAKHLRAFFLIFKKEK